MKIVVDIDNVICDFVNAVISFINIKLNKNYAQKDVVVWDFVQSPNIDIEYEHMMELFQEFSDRDLWQTIPIYQDAKDVLCWIADNHHIIYLTNRWPAAATSTMKYFEKHKLPFSDVRILNSYEDVVEHGDIVFTNHHKKANYAKLIGADLVIDDSPENIQEYLNEGIKTVLKEEPYNNWVDFKDEQDCLYRCSNLTSFRTLIEKFDKKEQI